MNSRSLLKGIKTIAIFVFAVGFPIYMFFFASEYAFEMVIKLAFAVLTGAVLLGLLL